MPIKLRKPIRISENRKKALQKPQDMNLNKAKVFTLARPKSLGTNCSKLSPILGSWQPAQWISSTSTIRGKLSANHKRCRVCSDLPWR
jgi:hypothetical protein